VVVVGTPGAFKYREVQVEGLTAAMDEGVTAAMGSGELQTRLVRLCTTDPVAFRSRPVHVRVLQGGSVVSETTLDNRACRDVRHPRFDGFVESIMIVLQPDGAVALPTPRQMVAEMTDELPAGGTEELMALPNGHTIRVRGGVAAFPAIPPPGSPPAIPQPWARCTGPGPRVDLVLGMVALARPMCGRRPCERRELGSSASPRSGDGPAKAFHGCGQ
jgi:hypothetical protein